MKKQYKTFVNSTAEELDLVVVSGGKIGVQIEINVEDLLNVIKGELQDIIKDS